MVYCGPPSRGCETCRKRKIRCDQVPLPDGCTQCARAKRKCPGYRDLQQVLFRNESAKVEKKVRSSSSARKKHSSSPPAAPAALTPASSDSASPDGERGADRSLVIRKGNAGPSPLNGARALAESGAGSMHALVSSPDDRAAGFFFSNFCNYVVFASGSPLAQAGLGAADLWSCEIDDHLDASMKAVGLYGLYRHSRNPRFEKMAWRRYLDAIRITNEALRNPQVATKDSSLLAVIILGLFESITGRTRESLLAWENHINGAAALISMRGRRQLETAVGRRMLMQITSSLLISCIQRDIVFPEPVKEIMEEATSAGIVDPSNPLYRLRDIMMDVANFRARWRHLKVWDCKEIVDRSLQLDAEIVALQAALPPSWQFRTVATPDDPEIVVNGYYHVYPGYWQANVWNSMRTCRLLLHGMMRKALLSGFQATPPAFADRRYAAVFADCTATLYQLQADVQASVPQHIGYLSAVRQRDRYGGGSPKRYPITRLGLLDFPWSDFDMTIADPAAWELAGVHLPIVRTYGSTLLLWTLFLVGHQDVTTRPTQEWVVAVLAHIGEAMGLRQANVLADILRDKIALEDKVMGGRPGPFWADVVDVSMVGGPDTASNIGV
ncbi:hypothetical protein GTA08_BOTSDO06400 [Neofusicoccum parvum]|nr:hypothetical protein GTA08_BOTSDO06400 [Neofusicoccum parvum]